MDNFKIFETNQFLKDLEDNLGSKKEQIKIKLTTYIYPQLRENPYFGKNIKKLLGYKPETWRYRIGSYRLFYAINDSKKIIFMLAVDHRQHSYS